MCSFHPKNPLVDLEKLKIISDKLYICPHCGKEQMHRVLGPCKTDDGIIVNDLERFYCMACGSDFFDLPAIKKIRRFREKQEKQVMETV